MPVFEALSLAVILLLTPAQAQRGDETPAQRPPQVALEVKSTIDVPSLGDPALVMPIVCSDQAILFRTATFGSISDVVAINPDGKQKASYRLSKVSEITQPKALTFFARGKYVFLLIRGYKGGGERRQLRRPDGTTESVVAFKEAAYYVAKYEADGNYVGSVELDVPFVPFQFGVFENGDFLISGSTEDRRVARVALVQANGQFTKLLSMEGDAQLRPENGDDSANGLPEKGKRFGEGFLQVLQTSRIIPDAARLLILRKGPGIPVFAVTAGGEVKPIKLDAPAGYRLEDVKVGDDFWVGMFTHRISDTAGVEFAIMAIDPETGSTLQTYAYPRFPGFGFACSDGREFTFLMNKDQSLKILTLQPSKRYSEQPTPTH